MVFSKKDVHSYLKPDIFDVIRVQTKEKMKENLKYSAPDPTELIDHERQIPLGKL